jgi:class 3 adenylate cyclase/DNA-binding transcriptional ArsR family regulator
MTETPEAKHREQERPDGAGRRPNGEPALTQARDAAAERRQLTLMFVDIVGSTALCERIDPESFFGILKSYQEICEDCARRYGGFLARSVGDAVLIYFGLPQAHEDDAERAIHAALSIIAALRERVFETSELGQVRLAVRIAVNTGLVVVGDLRGDGAMENLEVFGSSAIVAARLQEIAPTNAVVIGPATHELVRGAFECEPLGPQNLKGITHPTSAWRVKASIDSESRFERKQRQPLTPMLGRSDELGRLTRLWREAAAGRCRVAAISGEPGIGKSRIVYEFRKAIESAPHEVLFCQCTPLHANTPLAPVIEQVRRDAQISSLDTPPQAVAKLKQLLARAQSDSKALVARYGAMVSIPACRGYRPAPIGTLRDRDEMLDAIAGIAIRLSRQQPVLIIIEDIQWIDPTSLEVIRRLIARGAAERIMVVVTSRNESLPDLPDLESDGGIEHLKLTRLSDAQCADMIADLSEGVGLPRALLQRIVRQTDGIPLVVEELTRAVLESDAFERVGARISVRQALPETIVPSSILDSLMERLDRLGDAKHVAQVASVFGRQFSVEGLSQICDMTRPKLRRALDQLESVGLIRSYRQSRLPHYVFMHAMIQEAAYASLLKDYRRRLHERAAAWFQSPKGKGDREQIAVLAHHLSRAAMYEKAVVQWLKAGKEALRQSAHLESIAHLTEGLRLLSRWPDQGRARRVEIELQLHLAMAYLGLQGWAGPHVVAAYARALKLSRSNGTLQQRSMALWGVSQGQMVATKFKPSLKLAEEYLALGRSAKDDEIALMAHTAALTSNFYMGNLEAARRSVEFVRAHYRKDAHAALIERYHHDPLVVALVFGGHIYWLLGRPRMSRAQCREARRHAREVGHPFMLALAYILGSADHLYEHDLDAGWKTLQEGIRHAESHGLSAYRYFSPFWAIEAVMAHGPVEETLEDLAGRIEDLARYGALLTLPFYQATLAAEYGRYGQAARGLRLIEQAEALMRQTGEFWCRPEITRIRATLAAQSGPGQEADAATLFKRSLREARRMGALGWELRAALSFAEHLRDRGDPAEARTLLAEVVHRMPPRETSAELSQARALLKALA